MRRINERYSCIIDSERGVMFPISVVSERKNEYHIRIAGHNYRDEHGNVERFMSLQEAIDYIDFNTVEIEQYGNQHRLHAKR